MALKPLFCVTGCGRSGTGYTAQLLQGLGIQAGHERIFMPDGIRARGNFDGDVSCFAVPFLEQLRNSTVVHLVRHPFLVCRSYATRRQLFVDDPLKDFYGKAFYEFDKTPWTWNTAYDRVVSFWLRWNEATERQASARFRIEDLRDADTVLKLVDLLGYPRTAPQAQKVIAELSPRTNHKRHDPKFTFEQIHPVLRDELERTAQRYGYDLSQPTEIVSADASGSIAPTDSADA